MIGDHLQGLSFLKTPASEEERLYRAFALWGLNQRREAQAELDACLKASTGTGRIAAIASRLRAALGQGKIRVLAQSNDGNLTRQMKKCDDFDLVSVGYDGGDDIRLEPYETIESVVKRLPVGWVPHFFFCHQAELALLPAGIERAPFPVIGYIGDNDAHVQSCFHHIRLLDAAIVSDSVDHHEIIAGPGIPAYTFLKTFGIDAAISRLPIGQKDIDIFFSGTAFHPYEQEKSACVFRLTQLPSHYKVVVLNTYLQSHEYMMHMARAKLVFTFVRRYGAFPSRGLEALARGANVLYQRGGRFGLFFSEAEGAIPYTDETLEQVIARVVATWNPTHREAGLRGREAVQRQFDFRAVMTAYLQFLTFVSATVEPGRRRKPEHIAAELRYPASMKAYANRPATYLRAFEKTGRKLRGVEGLRDEKYALNVLMQAYAMRYLFARDHLRREVGTWLAQANVLIEEARRKFPANLSLLFNGGRIYYHSDQFTKAKELFEQVRSLDTYEFDPLDPVCPYDFFPTHFPFGKYLPEVVDSICGVGTESRARLVAMIRSSACFYLAQIAYAREEFDSSATLCEAALAQCDAVPYYHILHAKASLSRTVGKTGSGDAADVVGSLEEALRKWPWLIHPNISLLLEAYEREGGSRSAAIAERVEQWRRHVIARPDAVVTESEERVLGRYCDIPGLERERHAARTHGRWRCMLMTPAYLAVKLASDQKRVWGYVGQKMLRLLGPRSLLQSNVSREWEAEIPPALGQEGSAPGLRRGRASRQDP
jgi:tetratricopeptide (TPR) repeat protein